MPTDKENLIALLTEFGVGFEVDECRVVLPEGNARITGYAGFVTDFKFDTGGKFVSVGCYE
jgi:hypothetical protein